MSSDITALSAGPFHGGEILLQERTGVRDRVEQMGRRVIRDHMPDQHREFFAQLPFLVVGSLDGRRRPWASLLVGEPGFATSPDPRLLRVRAQALPGDPLGEALAAGAPLGLLGIQLETRRRNRLNGTVTAVGPDGFDLAVGQSFGNCPQYIQVRQHRFAGGGEQTTPTPPVPVGPRLEGQALALVQGADTFFIASAAPDARGGDAVAGVDVSHRGGRPGFVRVTEEDGVSILTSPDFIGNFHFNTFGNLALNPAAGLVFADFTTGDVLTLTGTAEVVWDGPELAAFTGAERLLRFRVAEGRWLAGALPLRWGPVEPSPLLAETGSWEAVSASLTAAAAGSAGRPFRVNRITAESDTVRSVVLEPADGGGIVPHRPGQFLPVILTAEDGSVLRRTYTLSHAANGRSYRISVKRDGRASRHIHDRLRVGDTIRVMAPRGEFTLDLDSDRPVILLSGGIGVTPMIAMLDALLGPTDRTRRPDRRVWFIHGVRNGADHAFAEQIRLLAARHRTLTTHIRYSAPAAADMAGRDYDSTGHVDAGLLRSLLPLDDYNVYLCGPPGFMQAQYDALRSLGVRDARIRAEAFGPAALTRRPDGESAGPAQAPAAAEEPAATKPVAVTFTRSGRTATWTPGGSSLLDLAEAAGVDAPYGCRSGSCGTCAARVTAGAVHHDGAGAARPPGHALICSAVPAGSGALAVEL
ncbi:MAG: hypothetical protein RLY86_1646 [Pseudomonadota bacterium]|jgi:ferredoxin-NADP reductase/predicted pyridoxine 5'-phosphate oxidase superfamily flavin-nucleotide-binding protein